MRRDIAARGVGPAWLRALGGVVVATALPLVAVATPLEPSAAFAGAVRVSPEALARVRGGFTSADGALQLSFGIRREVDAGGGAVRVDGDGLTLLQRGGGNVFTAVAPGTAAAVIQNSLDGQTLRTLTTIDIQANSLQVQRAAALQSTLGGGLTASLRR